MKKEQKPSGKCTAWRGRRAYVLDNGIVRLVTLSGGGHIAEFRFVESAGRPALNPLWLPPWKTIEPYRYRPEIHAKRFGPPSYGGKLMSGLVGHNVCLDFLGTPSEREAELELSDHGEAPNSEWKTKSLEIDSERVRLTSSVALPLAGLEFTREIQLLRGESVAYFEETVTNLRKADHFFQWTQHVTMGPPFLSARHTVVAIPGTRALTYPRAYEEGKDLLAAKRQFRWPFAPSSTSRKVDLRRVFLRHGRGFNAGVLIDPSRETAFVAAFNRLHGLLIGYCFRRTDCPWVAVWEENCAITAPPWNRRTLARALEFGTTPFGLRRLEAMDLGAVFGQSIWTQVPALGRKVIRYVAFLAQVPKEFSEVSEISASVSDLLLFGRDLKDPIAIRARGLRNGGLLSTAGRTSSSTGTGAWGTQL